MSEINELLDDYQDDKEFAVRKKILNNVWKYLVYRYTEEAMKTKTSHGPRFTIAQNAPWLERALTIIEDRIHHKHHYTLGF